jgi:HK97 family phage major capsid protein
MSEEIKNEEVVTEAVEAEKSVDAVVAEIKTAAVEAAEAVMVDAVKAEQLVAIEEKAAAEVATLKGDIEALEAKFDAIPTPTLIKETTPMSIHTTFEKNLEASGKAFADVEIKGISEARNVTGAPVDTMGLSGDLFAMNPVRGLSRIIETSSKAFELPVRTGNHGAANVGATKNVTDGGTAAVSVQTYLVQSYAARADVSIEAAADIVGFDAFWAEDMISEVASVEAAAHVAQIEAGTSITAASATELGLDDMAGLIFGLAPQYRASATLMLSTGAMAQLRTLNTASTGGDLVFDAQLGGFRLFGTPVVENAYMADVATGNVVACMADWKKWFVVGNRASMQVGRFNETVPGKYVYYADMRAASGIWHAEAGKVLTMA